MLFNSYIFIFLFLPVTLFVYFSLNHRKLTTASKAFLVVASLFYYSWWNIIYLPLILVSMIFNYRIGSLLSKKDENNRFTKKQILTFGVVANLSLLGYFKYADFFIENINTAIGGTIPLLNLALPLAISFFTFQQIAYLVDSYHGETKEYDFLNYAIFVTFFPQLIAGPIVHHKEMMPQFADATNKTFSHSNFAAGFYLFTLGLFKKVVIADSFAPWANAGFDVAEQLNFLEAWATSLSYTYQLYFDFSGYTDMALGIALLFNIKLPLNFDSPYKSLNIQDFWRRWHITLSRFFKKHFNTRRYVRLKENFDHWFALRQEAMNHAESKKGRAVAKNIDQAELNRAYYDLFFEGLLKSLITTWLPLLCTLAYVNRTFTPEGLMQWFGRPGLFMINGHPIFPWDIPSIFWFFISLLLVYALFPAMAWVRKTIKKETLRPTSP